MTKKKCGYFHAKRKAPQGVFCKCPEWDRDRFGRPNCPANTNSKCEIIPDKPKVRRVKAWAWINSATGQVMFAKTKLIGDDLCDVPCTITIAAKYLKPAKGKGK